MKSARIDERVEKPMKIKTLVRQHSWAASWPRAGLVLAYFFFLTTAAGATFYITNTYKAYINSDSATSNILAEEIARTGQFFPKDWWYVNSDLWVFFKHVFVLPWAFLDKNGFAAHASAVLLVSLIMLLSAFALLKQARCSTAQALFGAAALCLGFSDYYLEVVFGEAGYSWVASALFVTLALLLKITKSVALQKSPFTALIGLCGLIFLFTLANPARFFVFFITPVIGALILLSQKYFRATGRKYVNFAAFGPYTIYASICGAVFGLAFVLHKLILAELSNASGASGAALIPLANLPQAIGYFVLGILKFLGIAWVPGIKIASLEGVFSVARFFLYPLLLIAPALAVMANMQKATYEQKLLIFTGYLGLSLISFLVCATTLQGYSPVEGVYMTKYIVPFALLILLCNFCVWQFQTKLVRTLICGSLALAFVGSWSYFAQTKLRVFDSPGNWASIGYTFQPGWRQKVDRRLAFAKILVDASLTVGYAPYWHSHLYTVISNGALQVRPIHMDGGNLAPWLHLSSSSWYKTGYADGQVFLLVPKSEKTTMLPGLLSACMPLPAKQFEADDYLVLVYNSNPLMGHFNRNLDGEGPLCINASSRTQIGRYDAQKSTLSSPADRVPGYLHFGPYSLLERGDYIVNFDLNVTAAQNIDTAIGHLEVTADHGARVLNRQALTAGVTSSALKISIREPAAQNVEFRIYSTGAAELSLAGIQVQKIQ